MTGSRVALAAAVLATVAGSLIAAEATRAPKNAASDTAKSVAKPIVRFGAPGTRKVRVPTALLDVAAKSGGAGDWGWGAQNGQTVIATYQTFAVVEASAARAADIAAISPLIEVMPDENSVLLNAGAIDTSTEAARKSLAFAQGFDGKRMALVQFAAAIKPEWFAELEATGVFVVTSIPSNAYLVFGDTKSFGALKAMVDRQAMVQWTGDYTPAHRLDPVVSAMMADAKAANADGEHFSIQLVQDDAENARTLALLSAMKCAVTDDQTCMHYRNLIVAARPADLARVAQRGDVVSIQHAPPMRMFDERQAQIVSANITGNGPSAPGYLAWLTSKGFTQSQFTASDFVIDISDSGVDNGTTSPNHFGLYESGVRPGTSRITYNRLVGTAHTGSTLKGCDGHGTLNTHVILGYSNLSGFPFADATGYRYGLGICPFARVGSSVIFDPSTFTSPNYTTLQSTAYNDKARISSNSWGNTTGNTYTTAAQTYDALVRDAQPTGAAFSAAGNQPMVIVFAAGNAGSSNNTVRPPGTAKNMITVGATEGVQAFGGADGCGSGDTAANSFNDMATFSSRGPCSDGRRKPDIVAPGTHISGGVAQAANPGPNGTNDSCFNAGGVCGGPSPSMYFPLGQTFYTASSGTSHSTPAVSGGAALIRQNFINMGLGAPSPAMTKAVLMNSARYLTGTGAGGNLWSVSQGMGMMDLNEAFKRSPSPSGGEPPSTLRDQEGADTFTATGQSRVFAGTVADPSKPLRITLAWTDAPGATSGSAAKNNLDLTVTIGANVYKGNVFTGANSVTGGSADALNNVESVFIPGGTLAGGAAYTVTVTATNINSDGVPNSGGALDQDFALVVFNNGPFVPACTAPNITGSPPPGPAICCVNTPQTLTVTATGTSLSYQWKKNGQEIDGATLSSLAFSPIAPGDAGSYTCVVSNACGTQETAAAAITVIGHKCQAADIAWDDGSPLPPSGVCTGVDQSNSGVNEGDYNCFFQGFFDAAPACDIAFDDGVPLPPFGVQGISDNNGVNEGDYNCFFQKFFDGCP